jgi:hypothetical protein
MTSEDEGNAYRSSQGDAQSHSSGEFLTNERNQLGLGMYEKTDESGSRSPKAEEEEDVEIGRRSKRLRKQVEKDSSRKKNKYDGYNT